jgi:hypothetical protein
MFQRAVSKSAPSRSPACRSLDEHDGDELWQDAQEVPKPVGLQHRAHAVT